MWRWIAAKRSRGGLNSSRIFLMDRVGKEILSSLVRPIPQSITLGSVVRLMYLSEMRMKRWE
jgi:hypothetical protein